MFMNHRKLVGNMAERRRFNLFPWRSAKKAPEEQIIEREPTNKPFTAVAGIPDIVRDTERLRSDSKFDNEFDLYDSMLKLDPELNGAVRAVSLTANNYTINYSRGKNATIRDEIRRLVEENLDFDDFLINAMRGLMISTSAIECKNKIPKNYKDVCRKYDK